MLFHARKGTLSRFCTPSRKRLIHRIIYTNKNHNIMIKKTYLEAPQAELLVVRFEGNFCATGPYGEGGAAGGTMTTTDYGETDEDLF